jgi:hypothetical protein
MRPHRRCRMRQEPGHGFAVLGFLLVTTLGPEGPSFRPRERLSSGGRSAAAGWSTISAWTRRCWSVSAACRGG